VQLRQSWTEGWIAAVDVQGQASLAAGPGESALQKKSKKNGGGGVVGTWKPGREGTSERAGGFWKGKKRPERAGRLEAGVEATPELPKRLPARRVRYGRMDIHRTSPDAEYQGLDPSHHL